VASWRASGATGQQNPAAMARPLVSQPPYVSSPAWRECIEKSSAMSCDPKIALPGFGLDKASIAAVLPGYRAQAIDQFSGQPVRKVR